MSKTTELNEVKKSLTKRLNDRPVMRDNGEMITAEDVVNATETEIDAMLYLVRRRSGQIGANTTRFANRAELAAKIEEYWRFITEAREAGRDLIPDWEGFVSFLGVTRPTVNRWIKDDFNGFSELLELVKNDIAAVKNQLALHGQIPPMVWIAMMNNVHGYTQNAKVEVTSGKGDALIDRDSIIEQIAALDAETEP